MELEKAEIERSTYVTEVREVLMTEGLQPCFPVHIQLQQSVKVFPFKLFVEELPSSYQVWVIMEINLKL